jgi:hypothetical protein
VGLRKAMGVHEMHGWMWAVPSTRPPLCIYTIQKQTNTQSSKQPNNQTTKHTHTQATALRSELASETQKAQAALAAAEAEAAARQRVEGEVVARDAEKEAMVGCCWGMGGLVKWCVWCVRRHPASFARDS